MGKNKWWDQQYFSYIVADSFIGGGNRKTLGKMLIHDNEKNLIS